MRFGHIAGDRMLDLLNTVGWRLAGTDRQERIGDFDDLVDWCAESGVVSGEEAAELRRLAAHDSASAAHETALVLALRESAYAALVDQDPGAGLALGRAGADAMAAAALVRDRDGWAWHDPDVDLGVPRRRIARGLVDLLRHDDLDRLHQCEDARCGWVYLDTSPRRNRRWCDAKDCGDRNRARAYYARKKSRAAV